MSTTFLTSSDDIVAKLKAQFGEDIKEAYESYGMLSIVLPREVNIEVVRFLRDDPSLGFHFLKDECGVHYPFNEGAELGVVYLLYNMRSKAHIRVSTFLPTLDPTVRSMTELFASAKWMERETYDFYGIAFLGHPDLRRILNVDDMDYFPMRKEYPLEDATRTDKNDRMFGR